MFSVHGSMNVFDRQALDPLRDVLDRNGPRSLSQRPIVFTNRRHPKIADLADIEEVVDELRPADHRGRGEETGERLPECVVRGEPVADEDHVLLELSRPIIWTTER